MALRGSNVLTGLHAVVPASVPGTAEDKWMVIVDRASLLLIQALSGLYKVQEQCWRLLELHSIKIVSSGIIWVSLQEVGTPGSSFVAGSFWEGCLTINSTGFPDELAFPGAVGVRAAVPTATTSGV